MSVVEKKLGQEYLAFRYLVSYNYELNNDPQKKIRFYENIDKDIDFKSVLKQFNSIRKRKICVKNINYTILSSGSNNSIVSFKLGRTVIKNINNEQDGSLHREEYESLETINVFLDLENQIILIRNNRSIFSSINTPINILREFIRKEIKEKEYSVNIYPLVNESKFWDEINIFERIYMLRLDFNAPNMPLSQFKKTQSLLKDIQDITNNEKVSIVLQNEKGNLAIKKDSFIKELIDYILSLGGKYSIRARNRNGKVKTIDSSKNITSVDIAVNREPDEDNSDKVLSYIKVKANEVDNINNR